MRRMLVILKHSSALPAQLFDSNRILCHSQAVGLELIGWRKSEGAVCRRARMNSGSLKQCQVRIKGVWFTALIQAHTGGLGTAAAGQILLLGEGCTPGWSLHFCRGANCLFGVPVGLLGTQHQGTNLYLWGKASRRTCCGTDEGKWFCIERGSI